MSSVTDVALTHTREPGDSRKEAEQALSDMADYLFRLLQKFKAYPTDWNERLLVETLEHYRTTWMNAKAQGAFTP